MPIANIKSNMVNDEKEASFSGEPKQPVKSFAKALTQGLAKSYGQAVKASSFPALSFSNDPVVAESSKEADGFHVSIPEMEEWKLAQPFRWVIRGMFRGRRKSIVKIDESIQQTNRLREQFQVAPLTASEVLIRCFSPADAIRLLSSSTIKIEGIPMRFLRWSPLVPNLSLAYSWCILRGIPPHMCSTPALQAILKPWATVLAVDQDTKFMTRPEAVHVFLEIDAKALPPKSFQLHGLGGTRKVEIEILKPPTFCSYCNKMGHDFGICRSRIRRLARSSTAGIFATKKDNGDSTQAERNTGEDNEIKGGENYKRQQATSFSNAAGCWEKQEKKTFHRGNWQEGKKDTKWIKVQHGSQKLHEKEHKFKENRATGQKSKEGNQNRKASASSEPTAKEKEDSFGNKGESSSKGQHHFSHSENDGKLPAIPGNQDGYYTANEDKDSQGETHSARKAEAKSIEDITSPAASEIQISPFNPWGPMLWSTIAGDIHLNYAMCNEKRVKDILAGIPFDRRPNISTRGFDKPLILHQPKRIDPKHKCRICESSKVEYKGAMCRICAFQCPKEKYRNKDLHSPPNYTAKTEECFFQKIRADKWEDDAKKELLQVAAEELDPFIKAAAKKKATPPQLKGSNNPSKKWGDISSDEDTTMEDNQVHKEDAEVLPQGRGTKINSRIDKSNANQPRKTRFGKVKETNEVEKREMWIEGIRLLKVKHYDQRHNATWFQWEVAPDVVLSRKQKKRIEAKAQTGGNL